MLTVDQIQNISFKKASIGGYRCDDVDKFIDDVISTVEELKKQNEDLLAKSEVLMKIVEGYRKDEESIHQVLVKSQKEGDGIVKNAEDEAKKILDDAKAEADRIIADANNRIIREKEMINNIEQESAEIRSKLIEVYQTQIDALKGLPSVKELETRKKELDEKYPTEVYSDSTQETAPLEEEIFSAAKKTESDKPEESETNDSDGNTIQIEKSAFERKFGKLKFGDEYDVKEEK